MIPLKNAVVISQSEKMVKVVSGSKLYKIQPEAAMIDFSKVCKEEIQIPDNSIIKVSKASKRQRSFTCKKKR